MEHARTSIKITFLSKAVRIYRTSSLSSIYWWVGVTEMVLLKRFCVSQKLIWWHKLQISFMYSICVQCAAAVYELK